MLNYLYLAYLEKHEQDDGENSPIGLILCKDKNPVHIEIMQFHKSNIKVPDYLTILPELDLLLGRLQKSIKIAHNNLIQHNFKEIEWTKIFPSKARDNKFPDQVKSKICSIPPGLWSFAMLLP